MNYVPNQNGKSVQEKTLASNLNSESNADAVKATMRLYVISNDSPSFSNSSKISPHFSIPLSHIIESITNCSVG